MKFIKPRAKTVIRKFHSPLVLRCNPVDVTGFRGNLVDSVTVLGRLVGNVDNFDFMELSDEGPFSSLVVRYTVLPCLNQSVVVFSTSVDPFG